MVSSDAQRTGGGPPAAPYASDRIDAGPAIRYGVAVLAAFMGVWLRALLAPWVGPHQFLFLYPVAVGCVVFLGFGPALAAIGAGVGLTAAYFLPPVAGGQVQWASIWALSGYALFAGGIGRLIEHLRRAHAALGESQARLVGLLESSPIGIVLTDGLGRVLEHNAALARMLGWNARTGRDHWLVPNEDEAAGRGGSYETEVERADGTRLPVRVHDAGYHTPTGEGRLWRVIEDLTPETKARAALARRLRELQAVAENRLVGLVITRNRTITWCNDAFAAMFGYRVGEVVGRSTRLLHLDGRTFEDFGLDAAARLREAGIYQTIAKQRRKDGSIGWYEISIAALEEPGGDEMGAFVDATDWYNLERRLAEAENEARAKLAADLQDGLAQDLTGLSMLAGALSASLADGRVDAHMLERLKAIAQRATAACREIAQGLSPVGGSPDRFVPALNAMVTVQEDRYGVEIGFDCDGAIPDGYPIDYLDELYLIAQEAITNACRYARATHVRLSIRVQPDALRLEVAYDGTGIDGATNTGGATGLRTMRHRAKAIGAVMAIGTLPDGNGTLVSCQCFLPEEAFSP